MKGISAVSIERGRRFVTTDIWQFDTASASPLQRRGVRVLQVLIQTLNGFKRDKGYLHASALTFWSVLSLVPLLAMAFGIAKGFSSEKILERQLMAQFPGQEEILLKIFAFSHSLLENTRGGFIAGVGVLLLFWSVIKVFDNIEGSFNTIWRIETPRTFIRKVVDYLALIILCPLFFILSSGLTVYITSQVTQITEHVALLGFFSPAIFTSLKFLPYGLIWTLFSMLYIIMPNTRVRFGSGAAAGMIAGTLYQLAQWFYIWSQIGVARYNAIYGSFAALPLFLIWMQVSWIIVLLGTELSAAIQNDDHCVTRSGTPPLDNASKRIVYLSILHLIIRRFCEGLPACTRGELMERLGLPRRMVVALVEDLTAGGLVLSIREKHTGRLNGYVPATDVNNITVAYVIHAMDHRHPDTALPVRLAPQAPIPVLLNALQQAMAASPSNILVKDIDSPLPAAEGGNAECTDHRENIAPGATTCKTE